MAALQPKHGDDGAGDHKQRPNFMVEHNMVKLLGLIPLHNLSEGNCDHAQQGQVLSDGAVHSLILLS